MQFKTRLAAALSVTVVVGAAGLATIGLAGPAGAATGTSGGTWGLVQPLPGLTAVTTPPTSGSGGINAITCTARGDCVVVGYEVSGSGSTATDVPVVLTETAGTWGTRQQIGGTAGLGSGTNAQLAKVSCADARDCTATGAYIGTDGHTHAFYATETAGAWSTATAVSEAGQPAGTYSVITGVSCPPSAPGYCAFVGYYDTPANGTTTTSATAAPFIAEETQGTWETTPQPVSGLTGSAALESVSCAAQGECTAGGGAVGQPFVVSEASGTWGSAQPVAGVSAGVISTISCPDASDCTAAGYYDDSASRVQAFTADEQQGSWGAATLLASSSLIDVNSVLELGCSSAGNCVLADTAAIRMDSGSYTGAVADSETGSGGWGPLTPVPGFPDVTTGPGIDLPLSYLAGLSCVPGGYCTIVGYYLSQKGLDSVQWFAATTSGGAIGNEEPTLPATSDGPQNAALSCPQTGFCTLAYNRDGAPELVTEATAATVTLKASAPQVTYGSEPAETLTATVTGADGGTPTGTVAVTRPNGAALCTITLAGGSGTCTLAVPGFTGTITSGYDGAYPLTAAYGGDGNYLAAKGATTVTVARAATASALSVTPPAVTFSGKAQLLTFAGDVTSSAGTPTGATAVLVNGVSLGNLGACGNKALSSGKNACTAAVGPLAPGRYSVVLEYKGSVDFVPSTSATHYLTVSAAKTSTSLALSKSSVTYGHENEEKLTVSVSHVNSVYATGKVTVKTGSTTLCTITLSKGAGSCTLSASKLRAGTYQLSASFPGSTDYLKSASSSKTMKVAG
jgi:large repetitive protein